MYALSGLNKGAAINKNTAARAPRTCTFQETVRRGCESGRGGTSYKRTNQNADPVRWAPGRGRRFHILSLTNASAAVGRPSSTVLSYRKRTPSTTTDWLTRTQPGRRKVELSPSTATDIYYSEESLHRSLEDQFVLRCQLPLSSPMVSARSRHGDCFRRRSSLRRAQSRRPSRASA